MKIKCNLIDENITHAGSFTEANMICGGGELRYPNKIEYIKNLKEFSGITIFTDKTFYSVSRIKSPVKVAWLMEPKAYDFRAYNNINKFENEFNIILTHDANLLKRDPNKYVYLPADTTIIEDKSIAMHQKSKLTSFIYSKKQFLEGHKMRFKIAEYIKDKKYKIDSFGHGCFPIERKADALKDYCFSIAVENSSADNYFTDKILDCFATGTIPIYWGCPNVFDYFNKDGILYFKTIEELDVILKDLSFEKYESMLDIAKENFEKAKYYMRLDDIVLDTIIEKLNIYFERSPK